MNHTNRKFERTLRLLIQSADGNAHADCKPEDNGTKKIIAPR